MRYIVHRRFKGTSISGEVNLPAMTECELKDGFICRLGKPICAVASENSHQHFARNDDGQGMNRGKLTTAIQHRLAGCDNNTQSIRDRVWCDPICQKYKRKEHADVWLWNHDFFNADIADLRYIAALVGAKI